LKLLITRIGARLGRGPRHALGAALLASLVLVAPAPQAAAVQGTAFLDNGVIRVGIDANNGGAISYLSQSGSSVNLINTYDRGRQVQQSYYAGDALDRRAEGQRSGWSPWPWNPIAAGDAYGNRATVLYQNNTSTGMYVRTQPLLWDMRSERCECQFETWINLEGKRVRVHNKLTTFRTDNRWSVSTRDQELPAVYPIANLDRVVSYTGSRPFSWDGANQIPKSSDWIWSRWTASENWGACVDGSNFGVGVYTPGRTTFLGGLYGGAGGTTTSSNTCYLAPLEAVPLDKSTTFDYDYWLVVGTIDQIRQQAYALNRGVPAPAPDFRSGDAQTWKFNANGDFGGWSPNGQISSQSVSGGMLNGKATGPDPFMVSAPLQKPARNKKVTIGLRNSTDSKSAQLYFTTAADSSWNLAKSKRVAIEPESGFRTYTFDMSDVPAWTGTITRLRLDPAYTRGTFNVDWIRVGNF
jgi:hypothetical protein